MTQSRRNLMWALLAVLATILSYFTFRGYLTPELLLQFSNALHC